MGQKRTKPLFSFHHQLKELIEEFDDGEGDDGAVAPDVRHLRIENKNFYFACKKNAQVRPRRGQC